METRSNATVSTLLTVFLIAAALSIARDVFLPLALAILITFMLSPLVGFLRRRGLPKGLAVFLPVIATFAVLGLFLLVIVLQLGQIVQNLPAFQSNIVEKIDALKDGTGEGVARRISHLAAIIDEKIQATLPADSEQQAAQPVRIVGQSGALATLEGIVLPVLAPIATSGLVIVVVIFMLLEREQVRDRFIKMVGANDIALTTRMLEDAAERVSHYLLTQLLVNIIYAVPIGVGLWLIGVPNPLLWGTITLVFRFVPYVGSFLSAAFPLFMAFAASPDWTDVLWTGALFAVVEFVTSNFIEPQLYGSRTGLSPLAIIVSAIFWTFLWGPVGLVLSTPLTVCLVVVGRYVPQFAVFDILFGDEAPLQPHAQLYQRLLVRDRVEAIARAEEELDEGDLSYFLRRTLLPSLVLAQRDRDRGTLDLDKERTLAEDARNLISDIVELSSEQKVEPEGGAGTPLERLPGKVACVGGRWPLDEVSAVVLAYLLREKGIEAEPLGAGDLIPAGLDAFGPGDCVVLCLLDPHPSRASLLRIRRLRRVAQGAAFGVAIWAIPNDLRDDPEALDPFRPDPAKLEEARALGADFTCTSVTDAVEAISEALESHRASVEPAANAGT